jgi:hypothetical protein
VVKDFDLSSKWPAASIETAFPSPCGFSATFPGAFPKPIPSTHLPPTNYSFKVVFRVFRDFHSVPVKTPLCSSWNILYVQPQIAPMFRLEHSCQFLHQKNLRRLTRLALE